MKRLIIFFVLTFSQISLAQSLVLRCDRVETEIWSKGESELWEGKIINRGIVIDEDPGGGVVQIDNSPGLKVISSQALAYFPNDPQNYTIFAEARPSAYLNANWSGNPTTPNMSAYAYYLNTTFASFKTSPIYTASADSRSLAVGRSHWNIRDSIPQNNIRIRGKLFIEADNPVTGDTFHPNYFLYCAIGTSYIEAEWDGASWNIEGLVKLNNTPQPISTHVNKFKFNMTWFTNETIPKSSGFIMDASSNGFIDNPGQITTAVNQGNKNMQNDSCYAGSKVEIQSVTGE